MLFFILPIEDLKNLCPNLVEHSRKSNDGTKAIAHKEIILDALKAKGRTFAEPYMDEEGKVIEPVYPYPLASGDEINGMAEFQSKEEMTM